MFANLSGKANGGVAADMALEYDIGNLKALIRNPRPTSEFLSSLSSRLPLFQIVRSIVEDELQLSKVRLYRTSRALSEERDAFVAFLVPQFSNRDFKKPSNSKLDRSFDLAFTKVRKIEAQRSAVEGRAEDDSDNGVLGEDLGANEFENEFVNI